MTDKIAALFLKTRGKLCHTRTALMRTGGFEVEYAGPTLGEKHLELLQRLKAAPSSTSSERLFRSLGRHDFGMMKVAARGCVLVAIETTDADMECVRDLVAATFEMKADGYGSAGKIISSCEGAGNRSLVELSIETLATLESDDPMPEFVARMKGLFASGSPARAW